MSDSESSYEISSDSDYSDEEFESDSDQGACWIGGITHKRQNDVAGNKAINVCVKTGDISSETVDVIVNSAPWNLNLSEGKSSNALLKAAGSSIQRECKTRYPNGVRPGDIAITGPGRLNCSNIYHGILTMYRSKTEEMMLSGLMRKCLEQASSDQQVSIAFPAFGTGYLNFPITRVAEIMFDAIEEFEQMNPVSSLRVVYIVIYPSDNNMIQEFISEKKRRASHLSKGVPVVSASPSTSKKKLQHFKCGKIDINVNVGSISESETDVLVCIGPRDLQLKAGYLSASVLQAAGKRIQEECDRKYPYGIEYGEIVVTKPYNLQCRTVYHGAIPKWKSGTKEPTRILGSFMTKCLEQASEFRFTSIAFPVLGIDSHGFPVADIVNIMTTCLKEFERRHFYSVLSEVTFVIPSKSNDCEVMQKGFSSALGQGSKQIVRTKCSQTAYSEATLCSGKRGNIHVNVISGSLVQQNVDVIAITVALDLQLRSSSALNSELLDVAGDKLQDDLDDFVDDIEYGDIIVVSGHNLKCKSVYCTSLLPWYSKQNRNKMPPEDVLERYIYGCLHKCHKKNMRTMAMSAIGTGNLKFPADVSASKIVTAVERFCKQNAKTSLKEVKIVLHAGSENISLIEKAFKNALSGKSTVDKTIGLAKVPARGTKAFLEWKYKEELHPPSYWTHFKANRSLKDWNLQHGKHYYKLEDIDKKTFKSIHTAFQDTLQNGGGVQTSDPMTMFMYLNGLHFQVNQQRHYNVLRIQRLENTNIYAKYASERQRLFRKAATEGQFSPLEKIKGSTGIPITMTKLESDITEQLYPEVNEYYFFHGTKAGVVSSIISQGFDQRLAGKGRLGSGIYGAETASKSASYTTALQNGENTMFLMRVCLGDIYITKADTAFKRPPCKICKSTLCNKHPEIFDSVVADGGPFLDREFVVYDTSQAYPEYVITYI